MNAGAIGGPGGLGAAAGAVGSNDVSVQKEAFLKLLVAQLSNQDPLAPQESEQYIQQLTQFSTLEQLMNLNDGVSTLAVGQISNNSQEALRFVGRDVLANGDSVYLGAAGDASFSYRIDGEPAKVEVVVRDAAGNEVHRARVDAARPGMHSYRWDGQTATGNRAPEGRYQVNVEATDADGKPVAVDTWVRGRVTGVRFDNGYPELMIGDRRVAMGEVIEVSAGSGEPDEDAVPVAEQAAGGGWGAHRVKRKAAP